MSFTVIYLQVALMRLLNHAFYGTFTSLVISLALLGFGAGGMFLALNRRRIEGRENRWLAAFAGLTAFGVMYVRPPVHLPVLALIPVAGVTILTGSKTKNLGSF